jgi:hypothetical protein
MSEMPDRLDNCYDCDVHDVYHNCDVRGVFDRLDERDIVGVHVGLENVKSNISAIFVDVWDVYDRCAIFADI